MQLRDAITYPAKYRSELLAALENMDLPLVSQAIDIFEEARTFNRRVFICGNGAGATVASQFLCDLVKSAGHHLSARLRVLALTDLGPNGRLDGDDSRKERVFVDQLRNFAGGGDVVMAISSAGKPASVVCAIEYARSVGCRTIALTGPDGVSLAPPADVHILVPASQAASVEDGLMIVCHMIGNYFLRSEVA